MNVVLWVLQVLLAFHTAMGGVWKFANSEQAVPSLNAIPHGAWLGLGAVELLLAVGFLLPAVGGSLVAAAPVAALGVAAEMLLFSGLHLASGDPNHGQMIYWLVVAALCAFVAYGRFALRPL
jgi:hypothetical protein